MRTSVRGGVAATRPVRTATIATAMTPWPHIVL
jgi:hypothetical protein